MRAKYIGTVQSGHSGRAVIGEFSNVYSEKVIGDLLLQAGAPNSRDGKIMQPVNDCGCAELHRLASLFSCLKMKSPRRYCRGLPCLCRCEPVVMTSIDRQPGQYPAPIQIQPKGATSELKKGHCGFGAMARGQYRFWRRNKPATENGARTSIPSPPHQVKELGKEAQINQR